ncbi:MAG: hypothetical protein PHW64_07680 [Sulfuricurvum sp.]|nr:hypothetical protein [Sulfuricurvum sp.]
MIRFFVISSLVVLILGGCSAKEINSGVNDGINSVHKVIRGTNH